MKRQFIPDKEIILDKSTDLLNTSIYANNLANMIQQAPPRSSIQYWAIW